MRHSFATNVKVSVIVEKQIIFMNIMDNDIGISKENIHEANSFGRLGVRERLRALQGSFEIKGEPNAGTTLSISLSSVKVWFQ